MAQLLRAGGIIFLLCLHHCSAITNTATGQRGIFSKRNGSSSDGSGDKSEDKCATRLESALYNSRTTRRSGGGSPPPGAGPLDLNGYALHQALRSAPYDMYLTDMRVRAPAKWARVDKCRFDPITGTLQARLAFRDLSVTGKVKLYSEKLVFLVPPVERCNMTLRMRQAGVGFTVHPAGDRALNSGTAGPHVHTAATFVEPQFVSVHSYGCESSPPDAVLRRSGSDGPEGRATQASPDSKTPDGEPRAEMSQEMEEVFIRGVRSLITRYMEHHMEPALRDTLMMNLEKYIVEDTTMPIQPGETTVPTTQRSTTITSTVPAQENISPSLQEQSSNNDITRSQRITFYDLLG
ncbi:hypothetical protein GE061_003455 [Apolygus lucorum]|uniref:Uncharacterized protein n=1 Tax=Apolygus lucorum TaxID=248454 RepID=A0A8S9X233_APOLU|nr:hypothetical protein GE061_003455 [Apolygus lucorum]